MVTYGCASHAAPSARILALFLASLELLPEIGYK
jgi:hypothetical protein